MFPAVLFGFRFLIQLGDHVPDTVVRVCNFQRLRLVPHFRQAFPIGIELFHFCNDAFRRSVFLFNDYSRTGIAQHVGIVQLVIAGDDGGRDQNGTPSGSLQFRQRGRTGTQMTRSAAARQTSMSLMYSVIRRRSPFSGMPAAAIALGKVSFPMPP